MEPHGNFPDILYRAFDKLEHAHDFLNGKIRFGKLDYYRNIENHNRQDVSEGIGHFICNGKSSFVEFASNEIFILCFYKSLNAAKKHNIGNHMVKIQNPMCLAEEITHHLHTLPGKFFGGIEGCNVEYTKGHDIPKVPGNPEIARLAYVQKPDRYGDEDEFRFIILRKNQNNNDEFLLINLEKSLGNECAILI